MTADVVVKDGTAKLLPDAASVEAQMAKKANRRRRRHCIMNTVALTCVLLLLLVIIAKLLIALYPALVTAAVLKLRFMCGLQVGGQFAISGNTFVKDGQPFKYIAGSIHYSRLPAEEWRDRLRKMSAAGLDAIQTYVPWNFHQAAPGQSDWTGDRDLVTFLKIAQEEKLLVILRAGPYICAEWDFGGLPAWLMKENASMVIRSSDPSYLKFVDLWMTELLTKMKPLLYQNGGPIIMVQLENEYGSYTTCDKKYISYLYDLGRRVLGPDIILFTTDGNSAGYLRCGALDPRFFTTVDFGTGTANDPASAFADLRKIRPTGPLVNSEYYVGWLDIWGGGHAHVGVDPILQGLKAMYDYNASVNMYMFFGGTNFAYWNGAEAPPYNPQVTSYDYDAPLSEAGYMTWKYQRLRQVIHELKGKPLTNVSHLVNATATTYGVLPMKPLCHFTSLLPNYPKSASAGQPLRSMEAMGVYQGYAVYSAFMALSAGLHKLVLPVVRDRAFVFTADSAGKTVIYHGNVTRDHGNNSLSLRITSSESQFLHILVENGGHVNFARHMQGDLKGLFGNVTMDGKMIPRWQFFELRLSDNDPMLYGCDTTNKPSQGMFFNLAVQFSILVEPTDTYLLPGGFNKGQLLMNKDSQGHFLNVGRYWPAKGPQKALYVPRQYLTRGINDFVLFEVEGVTGNCPGQCSVQMENVPQLGELHRGRIEFRRRAGRR